MEDIKDKLKQKLAKDLGNTLFEMKDIPIENTDVSDTVTILLSRFNQVQKDFQLNIVSKNDRDLSLDKLRVDTLKLINSIPKIEPSKDRFLIHEEKSLIEISEEYSKCKNVFVAIVNWLQSNINELGYSTEDKFPLKNKDKKSFVIQSDFSFSIYGFHVKISYNLLDVSYEYEDDKSHDSYINRLLLYKEISFDLRDALDFALEDSKKSENINIMVFSLEGNNIISSVDGYVEDRNYLMDSGKFLGFLDEGEWHESMNERVSISTKDKLWSQRFVKKLIELKQVAIKIETLNKGTLT